MIINIYGHPYHSLEYYLYNNNSLYKLFKEHNITNSIANMRRALNYIDGVFAIQIILDNEEIWITDYYGLYPIFYNKHEQHILVDFINDIDLIINNDYKLLCYENIDKRYHSNLPTRNVENERYSNIIKIKNNIHKYLISPFKNWSVAQPGCIYYLKTKQIISYKYDRNFYNDSNENIFISLISNISKNKKVLVPLSAGYDSRTIFSTAIKYNSNVFRYTCGVEQDFVDKYFNKYPNMVSLPKQYNYDEIVKNNILQMNGMGDMYYKVHNFLIQPMFEKYDILFTGDGANEYLFFHPNLIIYKYIYATGDGHHYKTQAKKIITIPPFSQKRMLANQISNKYYNEMRKQLAINIIQLTNKELSCIPFYSGNSLTKNSNSNFGHCFNFNTKEKYLRFYYDNFY